MVSGVSRSTSVLCVTSRGGPLAGRSVPTADGVDQGTGKGETSAEFAKGRKWAREMAHKVTKRGDGYGRWEFHDGSVLTHWPDGQLEAK